MTGLEEVIDDLSNSIRRVKRERDDLLMALAPIVKAYEASLDPGVSDLDSEQPYHITVPLGDCRVALSLYRHILAASRARPNNMTESAS